MKRQEPATTPTWSSTTVRSSEGPRIGSPRKTTSGGGILTGSWCSKQFHAQHPIIRLLVGRRFLNSRTYQRIMRLASRVLPDSGSTESVIQDVDIPIENAEKFLEFLLREIRITPVWICPFQSFDPNATFPLYALDPHKLYVNFGFWDVIPAGPQGGYFNRAVEQHALRLAGKKGSIPRHATTKKLSGRFIISAVMTR
jgi:hypothetical protein